MARMVQYVSNQLPQPRVFHPYRYPHFAQCQKVPICLVKGKKNDLINLDCLFLDLYVPAKAIKNPSLKLPVISWFYGGGYTFGAKDQVEPVLPLYDGTGLIQVSRGNVIFVASNYRVRI